MSTFYGAINAYALKSDALSLVTHYRNMRKQILNRVTGISNLRGSHRLDDSIFCNFFALLVPDYGWNLNSKKKAWKLCLVRWRILNKHLWSFVFAPFAHKTRCQKIIWLWDRPYITSANGKGGLAHKIRPAQDGHFCSRSVLYLSSHSGWVQKSSKMCWRIIWLVPFGSSCFTDE